MGERREPEEGSREDREEVSIEKKEVKEGRRKKERSKSKLTKGKRFKIAFWNVASLENKDRNFWEVLEEWDIVVSMKTWVEEKSWRRLKNKLPKGFRWECQLAKRRNRKGRAMGGL